MTINEQNFHKIVVAVAMGFAVVVGAGIFASRVPPLATASNAELAPPAAPAPEIGNSTAAQIPSVGEVAAAAVTDLPAPSATAPAPPAAAAAPASTAPTPATVKPAPARHKATADPLPHERVSEQVAAAATASANPTKPGLPAPAAGESIVVPSATLVTSAPAAPGAFAAPTASDGVAAASEPSVVTAAPAADIAPAAESDASITAAVESKIAADTGAQSAQISVTTVQGVVVLSGTAPSSEVLEQVRVAATQVKDVKRVDTSTVTVSGS